MRRALALVLHGTLAVVAPGLVWIPCLILAVWGGFSLWERARILLAPGVPVRISYLATSGPAELWVDAYAIDPMRRTVRVYGARITAPDGERLASVDWADVTYTDGRWDGRARTVQGTIRREAGGRFSFERALPPVGPTGTPVPWTARIQRANMRYIDATKYPNLPISASVKDLRLAGLSGEFLGRALVQVAGASAVPATFDVSEAGWHLDLSPNQLDIAPLLPHLPRWLSTEQARSVGPIQAQRLVVSGRWHVGVPAQGRLEYGGKGEVLGRELTINQWLRRAAVSGKVQLATGAVDLDVKSREGGRRVAFVGQVGWTRDLTAAGRLQVEVDDRAALWPEVARAVGAGWEGEGLGYSGTVAYAKGQPSASGQAQARRLMAGGETFRDLAANLSLQRGEGQAKLTSGTWADRALRAGLAWTRAGQLRGFAETDEVPLTPLLARAGVDLPFVGSLGRVRTVVEGTWLQPVVRANVVGVMAYQPVNRPGLYFGTFELRVLADRQRVQLERFALAGPNGVLSAQGTYSLANDRLALTTEGGGFRLRALNPDWRGAVFADLRVTGSLRQPIVTGPVAVYGAGIEAYRWPVLSAELTYQAGRVTARQVHGESAVSRINGTMSVDLKSERLQGQFSATDLQLADVADGAVAGELDIDTLVLGGTVRRPQARATVRSDSLLVRGTALGETTGRIQLDGDTLAVDRLIVKIGDGMMYGSGNYDISSQTGSGRLVAEQLPIDRIARDVVPLTVSGVATAVLDAKYSPQNRWQAQLRSEVRELRVDGALIGTGPIEARIDRDEVVGSLQIGTADRFLTSDDIRVNLEDRTVMGRAEFANYQIRELLQAYRTSFPTADPRLNDLDAAVGATVRIAGKWTDPQLIIERVGLDEMAINGEPIGRFEAKGNRAVGGAWTVDDARWAYTDASATVRGQVTESGEIQLNFDAENLRGTWLPRLNRDWKSVPVEADLSFLASGTLEQPVLYGSVNALALTETGAGLGEPGRRPSLSLFPVEYKDERLTIEGQFYAEGFTGAIRADVPRAALRTNPDPEALISATLDLRDRELRDIAAAVGGLDQRQTRGVLGGKLTLAGSLRDPQLVGSIRLRDGAVGFKGSNTALSDLQAELQPIGRALQLVISAKGTHGGTADFTAKVDLAGFLDGELTADRFRETVGVEGAFNTQAWAVNEPILGNPKERVTGILDSIALRATGPLRRPVITGDVVFGKLSVRIPSVFPESTARGVPSLNPQFGGIRFRSPGVIAVENDVIRVLLKGQGTLAGSLAYPDFQSDMVVQGGLFNLPNARVALEPGGTLALKYANGEFLEGTARLDMDVEGRTTVSATKNSNVPDRYDIVLRLRGDLLAQNGVTIDASSDPPELSRDEILAVLGQKDLIEKLAAQVSGTSRTPVSQALMTLALPNLSSSLTREIASILQLDFLGLEYDAFAGPMLLAGETIAKGLTVTARRQIGPSVNGRRYYDLRMSYRFPSRNSVLSRFRVGLMTDQDRPWRLTLDYTVRF